MYFLKADEVTVWRGANKPTQQQIDWAAASADARGWNGCSLELYGPKGFVAFVSYSDGAVR